MLWVLVHRFVRMPGGCYVEGVSLQDAYWWKPSVGPIEERPGHYNGPWHYWSTDGMLLDVVHMSTMAALHMVVIINVSPCCDASTRKVTKSAGSISSSLYGLVLCRASRNL